MKLYRNFVKLEKTFKSLMILKWDNGQKLALNTRKKGTKHSEGGYVRRYTQVRHCLFKHPYLALASLVSI